MSRHRAHAKRNVRLAQISAFGLVALAGLVATMSAPQDTTAAPPVNPAAATPAAKPEPAPIDYASAIGVFELAAHQDKGAKSNTGEQKPEDEQPKPIPAPEPPTDDPWPHFNYVGMASMRRTYAIIQHPPREGETEGRTETIPQGDYIGDYLILGISSEKLVLSDCNDERREYLMVSRPEVEPKDSLLDTSTRPATNPAATQAAEMNGTTIHMPAEMNAANEQMERERIQAKAREMQEKRNQALKQSGQTPPTRPGPGVTHPRPMTPQPKPGNTKETVK
jgi:hypothetical protein